MIRQLAMLYWRSTLRGRPGFDVGRETGGACRGRSFPRKSNCQKNSRQRRNLRLSRL